MRPDLTIEAWSCSFPSPLTGLNATQKRSNSIFCKPTAIHNALPVFVL